MEIKKWIIACAALVFIAIPICQAVASSEGSEDEGKNKWYNLFNSDSSYYEDRRNKSSNSSSVNKRRTRRNHKKFNYKKTDSRRHFKPVDSAVYTRECGSCHFAYQPGLLPSGSWKKILVGLSDHFGEKIVLKPELSLEIKHYLTSNAAEYSISKRAARILRSLEGKTPLRISDTPYILRKHKELPKSIIKRGSIGSISNCNVCHMTAMRGIYSNRYVHIPN